MHSKMSLMGLAGARNFAKNSKSSFDVYCNNVLKCGLKLIPFPLGNEFSRDRTFIDPRLAEPDRLLKLEYVLTICVPYFGLALLVFVISGGISVDLNLNVFCEAVWMSILSVFVSTLCRLPRILELR